jgi:hypothetical protein
MVPKCEPTPQKALVVLDSHGDLPPDLSKQPGVVVRSTRTQLQDDIALKLRVANGTHTAIAHVLALLKLLQTDVLSTNTLLMHFLDALVEDQVVPGALNRKEEAATVYDDWRHRLVHPHFGLSSFFITQNGPAKGGIRWGPTVVDLVDQQLPMTVSLAFAYAALLRWLTPLPGTTSGSNGIFTGWLDGVDPASIRKTEQGAVEYADGLRHHLEQGWYEYKCPLQHDGKPMTTLFQACIGKQPAGCVDAIRAYLVAPEGGNLGSVANSIDDLVHAIAVLYARMLAGDGVESLLQELDETKFGIGFTSPCSELVDGMRSSKTKKPSLLAYKAQSVPDTSGLMKLVIHSDSVESVVTAEVQSANAIDLHTHLLPPTHGSLCLWGIDELLSYVSIDRSTESNCFFLWMWFVLTLLL